MVCMTLPWREQDSNHRSRVTRPIFQIASGWFPPTEKSERKRTDTRSVGPFPRGTDGSNPSPSSAEPAANFVFGREAWKGPRRRQGTIPAVSTSSGTDGSNPAPSATESVSPVPSMLEAQRPGVRRECEPGRDLRMGRAGHEPTRLDRFSLTGLLQSSSGNQSAQREKPRPWPGPTLSRGRSSARQEAALIGPVERQIEFGETRGRELGCVLGSGGRLVRSRKQGISRDPGGAATRGAERAR